MLFTIAVAVAMSQRARYSSHRPRPAPTLADLSPILHSQRNGGTCRGCAFIPFLSRDSQ
jgi:hypothetical protein